MKLFLKFRKKIGAKILNNKFSKLKRIKMYNNFSSAKNVGIIFNATNQELYDKAKIFIKSLTDKKIMVSALGFVLTNDAIKWYSADNNISFISLEDINWYFSPVNKSVKKYCEKSFDILIDITLEEKLPLTFVFALSKSKFKISSQYQKKYSDFVIDVKRNKNIEFFIQQLQHYMTSISKE
jgi:hypothetical protein